MKARHRKILNTNSIIGQKMLYIKHSKLLDNITVHRTKHESLLYRHSIVSKFKGSRFLSKNSKINIHRIPKNIIAIMNETIPSQSSFIILRKHRKFQIKNMLHKNNKIL
jgi:hypothetical protein